LPAQDGGLFGRAQPGQQPGISLRIESAKTALLTFAPNLCVPINSALRKRCHDFNLLKIGLIFQEKWGFIR
jgi:hypothetical protein